MAEKGGDYVKLGVVRIFLKALSRFYFYSFKTILTIYPLPELHLLLACKIKLKNELAIFYLIHLFIKDC